jgi:hypothetical protein
LTDPDAPARSADFGAWNTFVDELARVPDLSARRAAFDTNARAYPQLRHITNGGTPGPWPLAPAVVTATAPAFYDAGGSVIDLSSLASGGFTKVYGVDLIGQATAASDRYQPTFVPAAAYAAPSAPCVSTGPPRTVWCWSPTTTPARRMLPCGATLRSRLSPRSSPSLRRRCLPT